MKEKIEIRYVRARFHRRAFANLLDLLILLLCTGLLFLGSRAIVTNTPDYSSKEEELLAIRKESGLYHVESDGTCLDIVSYYGAEENNFTGVAKKKGAVDAISSFYAYAEKHASEEDYQAMVDDYSSYRLNPDLTWDGEAFFVLQDDEIVENEKCDAPAVTYFEKAYSPFIDDHLLGYLTTKFPRYLELTKYESNMLLYAEVLPSYLLAGILVYLVPPLCFHTTRATLGKAAYHIGVVDSRLLALSPGKTIARFLIFYFAELVLSLFTFGVPLLISASMMAFSKKKQNFPDYMLNLQEVDCSHATLYRSLEEAKLDSLSAAKKPVDFKPEE